jgi:hypothetical protein
VFNLYFLPSQTTVSSNHYVGTQRGLKAHLEVCPTSKPSEVLLLHDKNGPYTCVCTTDAITNFGWTVLPQPPYSPDPAPSGYHMFGPFKNACEDITVPLTRHSKMPYASGSRGGTVSFTKQEYTFFFKGERRLNKDEDRILQ